MPNSGMKHPLRHPSHPATGTPMIGPQLDPARSGAGQSMTPTAVIKQETNVVGGSADLMVPGQTHIGSPDTVSPYVDSTTYPTRLTPPGSTPDYFSVEELLNGTDHYTKLLNGINYNL